jgi:hypothetical protein
MLLFAGCNCVNSVGFLGDLPWRSQAPTVRCYSEIYQCVPPFLYWRWDQVPKRAIWEVELADLHSGKTVLSYRGKLKSHPPLDGPKPSLVGDLLTVTETDKTTHESWIVEFRRGPDGQFRLLREQGSFRK